MSVVCGFDRHRLAKAKHLLLRLSDSMSNPVRLGFPGKIARLRCPFACSIYGSPLYKDSNDTRNTPVGKKLTLRMQAEDFQFSVGFPRLRLRLREHTGTNVLT